MTTDYIHGFSAPEQDRLTAVQEILNKAELRELDLVGVRSILDVGAGLGQFTRMLARAAGPSARVVGIERDSRQRVEAQRQAEAAGEADLIELRAGDAERLPLDPTERATFDLVHARFLLEHVPDPLAVVREMVAAVRPGGRVVLVDDDHDLLRLWPACPPLERAWRIYWESYRDRGHDPLVGRRLPGLLHEAGARVTRVTSIFYGAPRHGALFDLVVDNLAGVIGGAAEELDRSGRLSREELEAALEAFQRWRQSEAATVWYSLPMAEGQRSLRK